MLNALEADRACIADIEAQILDLEHSLSALRAEKWLIQQRLDSYIYPVLTLPTEIVSEISIHFIPPYPFCPPLIGIFSPNVLAAICHDWREIVLSTPSLWRAIQLSYYDDPRDTDRQVYLSKLWLSRSSACLLSVQITGKIGHVHRFEGLDSVISKRARWEFLKIVDLPQFPIIDGPLPVLSQFVLELDRDPDSDIVVCSKAPLLRTVTLNNVAPSHVKLSWGQLTELTLKSVRPRDCVPILRQTSSLIHCTLGLRWGGGDFLLAGSVTLPAVRLPQLQSWILSDMDGVRMTGFLGNFIVPALRSLQMPESWLGTNPVATLASFITKTGCQLQVLGINGGIYVIKDLDQYRHAFPYISKLFLDGYAYTDDGDVCFVREMDELCANRLQYLASN